LKIGTTVRLNAEGRLIRDEEMRRWVGTVKSGLFMGRVSVEWQTRSIDSPLKTWTERREWLEPVTLEALLSADPASRPDTAPTESVSPAA
jgi:hypothetical protein